MSLKAETLKTNPNKNKYIMKEVTAILGRMDDEIKAAYDEDKCKVEVTVPITFHIPHMKNQNAQRAIYYKILESLLERNYIVKIFLTEDQTVFAIKWLSEEEENDKEQQNALLAKYSTVLKTTQS